MSEAVAEARDSRGDWQPAERPATAPLWAWPPRPLETLKWIAGYPGYLFPWNAIFFLIALLTWAYVTPEMARMVEFRIDWIAEIYVRNLALLVLWAGGWHLRLYTFKGQGAEVQIQSKMAPRQEPDVPVGPASCYDNMFWNIASACTVWSAYEVGVHVGLCQRISCPPSTGGPSPSPSRSCCSPSWCGVRPTSTGRIACCTGSRSTGPSIYVHHKNVNVGPWSGLAMHPVEHLVNFSAALIFIDRPCASADRDLDAAARRADPGAGTLRFRSAWF